VGSLYFIITILLLKEGEGVAPLPNIANA